MTLNDVDEFPRAGLTVTSDGEACIGMYGLDGEPILVTNGGFDKEEKR